jgi:hypothetical protein
MKREMTLAQVVAANVRGERIRVVVDNDRVGAYRYEGDEPISVSFFADATPQELLYEALDLLGIPAEPA